MIKLIKFLALIFAISLFFSCKPSANKDVYLFSYFKKNGRDGLHLAYSYNGYSWKALRNDSSFLAPTVSKDSLMRDPCIIHGVDGKFHMVWTVSWNEKGIGYANSSDLINWSEQQYIPVMEHEPDARNCWAPELLYDKDEEIYMIYWATTIPDRFTEGDSSSESGYNHRMYYTTTKDFVSFSETQLLYDHGFSIIDAVIRKYSDTYYMFLKDETKFPNPEKNLKIATSKSLTHSYSKPSESITKQGVWVEGPAVNQIADTTIIYFDMYRNHQMGAIKSTNLKDWTDISDAVSFPKGTRHGTVFKVPEETLNTLLGSE
jgi:predicted GH43/DUF377 family glycosyl hydrolase